MKYSTRKWEQTLEFEQCSLRNGLAVTPLVLRQTPFPLVSRRKDNRDLPPEAGEQLQLVTTCREEDVALKSGKKTMTLIS